MKEISENDYFQKLHKILYELEELRKTEYWYGINQKTEELFHEISILAHKDIKNYRGMLKIQKTP